MKRAVSGDGDEEILVSYKRLCNVKREENGLSEQIKKLDEQINELNRRRSELRITRDRIRYDKFEDALVPYSKLVTRQFAETMRNTLPRELRDLVYDNLWDSYTLETFELEYIIAKKCPGRPCLCLRDTPLPVGVDPSYVGPEIAKEAVKALYQKADWLFALEQPEMIKHTLHADAFHVGYEPYKHLRRLTIDMSLDACLENEYKHKTHACEKSQSMRDMLEENFHALLDIPNKRGFHLDFTLAQHNIRLNSLETVLTAFTPVFEAFKKEGANLTVNYTHHGCHRPEHFKYSLNETFEKASLVWKEEIKSALEKCNWIDRIHRKYLQEDDPSDNPGDDYSYGAHAHHPHHHYPNHNMLSYGGFRLNYHDFNHDDYDEIEYADSMMNPFNSDFYSVVHYPHFEDDNGDDPRTEGSDRTGTNDENEEAGELGAPPPDCT